MALIINSFEDLDLYSINQLLEIEPDKLTGKLIDCLTNFISEQKEIEIEKIQFEIKSELQSQEKMYFAGIMNDWNGKLMNCRDKDKSIWQIDIQFNKEISFQVVEYKFFSSHKDEKKWQIGDNKKIDLAIAIKNLKSNLIGDTSNYEDSEQKFEYFSKNKTIKIIPKNVYFK